MNIQENLEGDYINVALVQKSPSKKCIIIGAGKIEETDFGRKVMMPVEIDGKSKTWRLNRMTLENMSLVFGVDTIKWLSVVVELRIMNVKGKDCVVGYPMVSAPKEYI